MALVDIDLEFEDEDEGKRKKNEAFQVDGDLEFAAPQGVGPRPAPKPSAGPAVVTNISDAKNVSPRPSSPRPVSAQGQTHNAALVQEVASLRKEIHSKEIDVAVKEAMLDFKIDLLTDLGSDIKIMDLQVGQILSRLGAKHPESKQELLMIKKLLADFTAKKRK